MTSDEPWWWGWSGIAGGAWACVVCLVIILGSVVNLAVLVHWFTTKPTQELPSAALPFADFLVCFLAAPLRYTSHTSSLKLPTEKDSLPLVVNFTAEVLEEEEALIFAELSDEKTFRDENVNLSMTAKSGTGTDNVTLPIESLDDDIHAVVVFICLASLHVVTIIAIHRLALLLRCSPSLPQSVRINPPVFVLLIALVTSGSLVGSLHATGNFTDKLPLLGMVEYPPERYSSPIVIGFLSYTAGLCGIAAFCYGTIIATLLYQGRDRSVTNLNSRQDPQFLTFTTTSSAAAHSHPEEEATVQAYSGHGKTLRACLTVVSVLVTLSVCWAIPVSLALYALLTEAEITPALPYSDVLLLLSGLIHPFVYGEGWLAMAACYSEMHHFASAIAYRMGLTKQTRTAVRSVNTGRRSQVERRNVHHQGSCWCCPHRTADRIPDTHLFSEMATFVNSFPLRHALSRHDADPL